MTVLKKGLYLLFIDGGKRANSDGEFEAEGAIGALLKEPNGQRVEGAELSRTIGRVPDPHSAEYQALFGGLELAKGKHVDYVAIFSDSRTLVNQVNGLWKSKGHLARYREQAWQALKSFKGWQLSWLPREMNREADALVNDALDSADVEHAID